MRDAMARLGGDPADINPLTPIDLVIDHSITVDVFGRKDAFARNLEIEYARNRERYAFFKWAQTGFRNLRIIPRSEERSGGKGWVSPCRSRGCPEPTKKKK